MGHVRLFQCDFVTNEFNWFFHVSESKIETLPTTGGKLIRSKDPTLRIEGGGSHVLWNPVFSQWKNMEGWRYGEEWPVWSLTFFIHFVFAFFFCSSLEMCCLRFCCSCWHIFQWQSDRSSDLQGPNFGWHPQFLKSWVKSQEKLAEQRSVNILTLTNFQTRQGSSFNAASS